MKQLIAFIATACFAISVYASPEEDAAADAKIRASFATVRQDFQVQSVTPTPLPGIYSVALDRGIHLYATADGVHFWDGKLYRAAPGKLVDLEEEKQRPARVQAIAKIPTKDMIIFSPKGKPKATLTVFTDVDCHYCQVLHKDIAALNAMGIEIRYLAFPRAGLNSPSFQKIATAFCAKGAERNTTLTKLKNGEQVPMNVCPENPVGGQLSLGQMLGVQGTPALIKADGTMLPGYMPPEKLALELGLTASGPAPAAKQ